MGREMLGSEFDEAHVDEGCQSAFRGSMVEVSHRHRAVRAEKVGDKRREDGLSAPAVVSGTVRGNESATVESIDNLIGRGAATARSGPCQPAAGESGRASDHRILGPPEQ